MRQPWLNSILAPLAVLIAVMPGCKAPRDNTHQAAYAGQPGPGPLADDPFVVVLGIAQDGGYPQAGCDRNCCRDLWNRPDLGRYVASLGIVDPVSHERWIIDATPDFRKQLRELDEIMPPRLGHSPDLAGVILTHAHIGHYTGLMFLGHESMGAQNVPVHAMPRLTEFLSTHGPWDQLVAYHNIALRALHADEKLQLNDRISITPFLVPHRQEYSEVVGFRIQGPNRSVLYVPDSDKWERWDRSIEDYVRSVDRAYLDGTFFDDQELPGRDMSVIPHPFISETIQRFDHSLDRPDREKVRFIHLNHTNPALRPGSQARNRLFGSGMYVALQLEQFGL